MHSLEPPFQIQTNNDNKAISAQAVIILSKVLIVLYTMKLRHHSLILAELELVHFQRSFATSNPTLQASILSSVWST